jgi:hypothetical protein
VNALQKRVWLEKTQDVSEAWRWFQNEDNLELPWEKPWQEFFDDRLAFAGLVGCFMSDLTWFLIRNKDTFLWNADFTRILGKQFDSITWLFTDDDPIWKDLDVIWGFKNLLDVFFHIVLVEWNKYTQEKIATWEISKKMTAWIKYRWQLNDVPVVQRDLDCFASATSRWREKAQEAFWIAVGMSGGLASLSEGFVGALHRFIHFHAGKGDVVSNNEIKAYMWDVHILLLERMREFTPFARMMTHVAQWYQKTEKCLPYEQVPSGHVLYSEEVMRILETDFDSLYAKLRDPDNWPSVKEKGTMQCPVKMSVYEGENVVSVLCREILIPLFQRYWLPWREKLYQWEITTDNPEI